MGGGGKASTTYSPSSPPRCPSSHPPILDSSIVPSSHPLMLSSSYPPTLPSFHPLSSLAPRRIGGASLFFLDGLPGVGKVRWWGGICGQGICVPPGPCGVCRSGDGREGGGRSGGGAGAGRSGEVHPPPRMVAPRLPYVALAAVTHRRGCRHVSRRGPRLQSPRQPWRGGSCLLCSGTVGGLGVDGHRHSCRRGCQPGGVVRKGRRRRERRACGSGRRGTRNAVAPTPHPPPLSSRRYISVRRERLLTLPQSSTRTTVLNARATHTRPTSTLLSSR